MSIPTYTPGASGMVGSGGLPHPALPPSETSELDQAIRKDMESFYFSQAERAIGHGLAWGSFFIMAAAMHVLAALHSNCNVDGKKFRSFVAQRLPGYDAKAMWHSFRCGLFHEGGPSNFSSSEPGVMNVVVTTGCDQQHDPDGSKLINQGLVTICAESLLRDLRVALDTVLTQDQIKAHKYYRKLHASEL